eukprot:6195779-Pleurochrysis_carterae.AAC.6
MMRRKSTWRVQVSAEREQHCGTCELFQCGRGSRRSSKPVSKQPSCSCTNPLCGKQGHAHGDRGGHKTR